METERPIGAESWLYLYGVVRRAELEFSGVKGIEEDCNVFLVCCGELACAVSPVPRSEYNQENLKARAQQLDWIAPRAVRHQEVVEHLRQAGAVVPLKFGTLCSTPGKARELLQEHYQSLLQLLTSFEGREEWGVKVYVDADLTSQAIERAVSQAGYLADEISPGSEGEAYFLRKKKQKLASERMTLRISKLGDEIYERLQPCGVDARKGHSLEPASNPSRLHLLNTAFLVDQQKSAALAEVVGQLEADYRDYGIAVELSGPWAPYSFCGDLSVAPAGDATLQVPRQCGN